MPLKTVLITSAGLAGKGIEATAPEGVEIITAPADKAAMRGVFETGRIDAVVHCPGVTDAEPQRYMRELVALCKEFPAYLVYVSSGAVFDGKHGPFREDHAVCPESGAGRACVECEIMAVTELENCSVARPALMYGWEDANPVSLILRLLRAGTALKLADNEIENPVYNIQFGKAVWRMLETQPWGVFHIGGGDSISRYEFGLEISGVFGADSHLAVPVSVEPANASLDIARMETELGIKPITFEEGLKEMLKRENTL
ncbi:MAG: sugar nucleotide-binding protein [Elusimicrobiaceae bacterium]|jgi:dTDP-4-dehydrorhamnose reductase